MQNMINPEAQVILLLFIKIRVRPGDRPRLRFLIG
jgi:hypothetical protein